MQTHRYSFFGQKTAVIFQSGDWIDPHVFLTFIKKRDGGAWEKLAVGKTVKLSLPEVVALRDVVAGTKPEWKTYHKSNGAGTPISARLESGKDDRGSSTVLLSAGEYLRPIAYPETTILEKILDHVFEEKIAHATGSPKQAPEESPQVEPASEAPVEPAQEPPLNEIGDPAPEADDMTLVESLARFNIPPLPRRLPSGVFPMTGRLKAVRTDNGVTTLSVKMSNGAIEEILATDIVGAGVHGSEVDLVVKAVSSPKANPAAQRGKPGKTSEDAPDAPAVGALTAAASENVVIRATSVKKVTERALLVTNAGGTELWIPKSALADDVPAPAAPQVGAWQFTVKAWFAQKADFQDWVKST